MKSKIILFLLLLLANVVRANDGSYFVSGNQLILKEDGTALEKKILNNLPYANRGLVFQDKELQAFFEKHGGICQIFHIRLQPMTLPNLTKNFWKSNNLNTNTHTLMFESNREFLINKYACQNVLTGILCFT